ncbi:MAG: hypothetical protein ACRDL5_11985 [Solirubrobacteraceae bacterium]
MAIRWSTGWSLLVWPADILKTPDEARPGACKGDLDDYWEHHITLDQQRLYRHDDW